MSRWLFINSRNTWGNWVFDMVSDLLNHSAITQIRWIVSIYRSQTEMSMTGPVSFPILSHQPQLCTKDKFLTRMCRQESNTCMNRSRSSTNHDDLFSYLSEGKWWYTEETFKRGYTQSIRYPLCKAVGLILFRGPIPEVPPPFSLWISTSILYGSAC